MDVLCGLRAKLKSLAHLPEGALQLQRFVDKNGFHLHTETETQRCVPVAVDGIGLPACGWTRLRACSPFPSQAIDRLIRTPPHPTPPHPFPSITASTACASST